MMMHTTFFQPPIKLTVENKFYCLVWRKMFRGVPTARHMMCTIKQGLKPLSIAVQSLRDENRKKSPYLCQTPRSGNYFAAFYLGVLSRPGAARPRVDRDAVNSP
jgi:hypothetical protein